MWYFLVSISLFVCNKDNTLKSLNANKNAVKFKLFYICPISGLYKGKIISLFYVNYIKLLVLYDKLMIKYATKKHLFDMYYVYSLQVLLIKAFGRFAIL